MARSFSPAPTPNKKSQLGRGVLIVLATMAVPLGAAFVLLFLPLPVSETTTTTIPYGASLRGVSTQLTEQHIVRYPMLFEHACRLLCVTVQAGDYQIQPGMRYYELIRDLRVGRVVVEQITFLPGWTFAQVWGVVHAHPAIAHTLPDNPQALMIEMTGVVDAHSVSLAGVVARSPEGQFFPDTYHFARGTTDKVILKQAYARMQRVLDELWPQRAPMDTLNGPQEALILASIIEKESALIDEMPKISAVLHRRLARNMRLQADPTVIFALGANFKAPLQRQDLKLNSPYNTYRYAGLPPTPIALPSKHALQAALCPEVGQEALYYVANGQGGHEFSEHYEQHQAAIARVFGK
ncbi:MAG: endolytic transglycosylase MltG [Pseudomonadota bacterium]